MQLPVIIYSWLTIEIFRAKSFLKHGWKWTRSPTILPRLTHHLSTVATHFLSMVAKSEDKFPQFQIAQTIMRETLSLLAPVSPCFGGNEQNWYNYSSVRCPPLGPETSPARWKMRFSHGLGGAILGSLGMGKLQHHWLLAGSSHLYTK